MSWEATKLTVGATEDHSIDVVGQDLSSATPVVVDRKLDRPMRILLVTEALSAGAGRHVSDLAKSLQESGHNVTVVYSPGRADPIILSELSECKCAAVPIQMKRAVGGADALSLIRLISSVNKHGPFDIIHGHSSKAGALVRLLPPCGALRLYTPHAFRSMDGGASPLTRHAATFAEWFLARLVRQTIILVSSIEYRHALDIGLPARRLRLIVNGLYNIPHGDRVQARELMGHPNEVFVVGFVGRFSWQKAPERFVEVLKILSRDRPDIRGVMVGSGDLRDKLLGLIDRADLSNRIALREGEGVKYLPGFDVLLMTSRYEGMPYVLLEAASFGLPMVSTAVGGVNEIIRNGTNGYVVEQDDIDGMARCVERLLMDPGARARARAESHRISSEINGERMTREVESLYKELLRCR